MRLRFGSRAAAVRPAAVAGLFYPRSRVELEQALEHCFAEPHDPELRPGFPKAVVVPHAGYVYSGPIAASAYALLRPARGVVRRVVLLGPCHRVAIRGLALPTATAFETPLGPVRVDTKAAGQLADLAQVVTSDAAHAPEHSLEVQLPFLQSVLGDFELVPLAVGQASAGEVAAVLDRLWGGPETLVVVSSDLSHYHDYDSARAIDRRTVDAVLEGRSDIDHEHACGATPLCGLVEAASRRDLSPELLDLRSSGDTAGDRDHVVGYAAIAYWQRDHAAYGDSHGETLVSLARSGIASALRESGWRRRAASLPEAVASAGSPSAWPAWLAEERATFVTLKQRGRLRGCIGSMQAHRPLAIDVVANACAAALEDPRFGPVGAAELGTIRIEVSLLSDPSPIGFVDHDDLVAQLRPGVDGLILTAGGRRGTFLPQVWEMLPDPEEFLAELKRKAGLPVGIPTTMCRVERYRTWKWQEREQELRTAAADVSSE